MDIEHEVLYNWKTLTSSIKIYIFCGVVLNLIYCQTCVPKATSVSKKKSSYCDFYIVIVVIVMQKL